MMKLSWVFGSKVSLNTSEISSYIVFISMSAVVASRAATEVESESLTVTNGECRSKVLCVFTKAAAASPPSLMLSCLYWKQTQAAAATTRSLKQYLKVQCVKCQGVYQQKWNIVFFLNTFW